MEPWSICYRWIRWNLEFQKVTENISQLTIFVQSSRFLRGIFQEKIPKIFKNTNIIGDLFNSSESHEKLAKELQPPKEKQKGGGRWIGEEIKSDQGERVEIPKKIKKGG